MSKQQTHTVVIEVLKGSPNKFELNESTGELELDRTNLNTLPFPFDYGFFPNTQSGDNDPLDVVVLTSTRLRAGDAVLVQPMAVLKMTDSGLRDDKIIARVVTKRGGAETLQDKEEKQILAFFQSYKESGIDIEGFFGVEAAHKVIIDSIKNSDR